MWFRRRFNVLPAIGRPCPYLPALPLHIEYRSIRKSFSEAWRGYHYPRPNRPSHPHRWLYSCLPTIACQFTLELLKNHIKRTLLSCKNSTISRVLRMSGIFSSKLARLCVKLDSMYRYLLSFQKGMGLTDHQVQSLKTRTQEHLGIP